MVFTDFSSKSKRSHMTGVTAVSGATSNPGKSNKKAGVVIETMYAPNPVSYKMGRPRPLFHSFFQLFKQANYSSFRHTFGSYI